MRRIVPVLLSLCLIACSKDEPATSTPANDAGDDTSTVADAASSATTRPSSTSPFLSSSDWDSAGAAFQDFLAEHKLSSHLWVVARRVSTP